MRQNTSKVLSASFAKGWDHFGSTLAVLRECFGSMSFGSWERSEISSGVFWEHFWKFNLIAMDLYLTRILAVTVVVGFFCELLILILNYGASNS